jgi:hypothetical protein
MISSWAFKITLWSLLIGVVGTFTGFASGAIGICGNGGWGIVPALIGVASLCVCGISFVVWIAALLAARIPGTPKTPSS